MSIWQKQAKQLFLQGRYEEAIELFEDAIKAEPENKSSYWYIGLILLLQGNEAEAQTTWLLAMAEGEAAQIEEWTKELVGVLDQEAVRRLGLKDYQNCWLIRRHIQEISPDNVNNLLHLAYLSIRLNIVIDREELLLQIAEFLYAKKDEKIHLDTKTLLFLIEAILDYIPTATSSIKFIDSCTEFSKSRADIEQGLVKILFTKINVFIKKLPSEIAIKYTKIARGMQPGNISVLVNLANLYQNVGKYLESREFIQEIRQVSETEEDKIAASYLEVRALIKAGGYWQEALDAYERMKVSLQDLLSSERLIQEKHLYNFIGMVVFSAYFADELRETHQLRNQISQYCQSRLRSYYKLPQTDYLSKPHKLSTRHLKIGYLSSCFRRHSVGWISRWLFRHHHQENFATYGYALENTGDNLFSTISNYLTNFRDLSQERELEKIAEFICQDEIDILIDLDSLTSSEVCGIMALKPAPIQVTWLGSDASGLPAIDYFIADPYVLPENAQEYYQAKIWRLPQTYVAVDGFEVGVPTLRREDLNIQPNAVVYLSSQTGYKRHPHTARLQMRILKEVPDSYFLIKGIADEQSIKRFFSEIAREEGVEVERLRFLPMVAAEETHRANLGIADVVLDTYPYNGATTTLETLWMGIPLVTRVGEQFAARNSYTMLKNAGVEEGIAWSDEEYVEWGVRLGKDANLRQQISWQLWQSRQNAPLWNARQFTREMEQAYLQMWEIWNSSTRS